MRRKIPQGLWLHALAGGLRPGCPSSPSLGWIEGPPGERRVALQREARCDHLQGRSLPHPRVQRYHKGKMHLGEFSLKKEARPSEADWAGTATSTTLFLLKTRLEQVSSSSEAVASTTPFCLRSIGVGA